MLATRLDPPSRRVDILRGRRRPAPPASAARPSRPRASRPRASAEPQPRPTRGPRGDVWWWQRRAPRGDDELWQVVRSLQQRRMTLGMSVTELARRTEATSRPLRRETLSRVLNGIQPTTWETARVLAEVLDADPDLVD